MAQPDHPGTSRRPRRQERGRRRIELILDAAEQVLAEAGYDAATTNVIAARAGISPGSLYQYFTGKPAIVEALAQRYLSRLAQLRGGVFGPEPVGLPLAELVDQTIDPLVAFNLAHPAATSLLAGAGLSPELTAATKDLHAALCDRVEGLIGELAPGRSGRDRQLAATMSIQIFSSTLPAILAAPPGDRPPVIRELKSALGGYWAALERSPAGRAAPNPHRR